MSIDGVQLSDGGVYDNMATEPVAPLHLGHHQPVQGTQAPELLRRHLRRAIPGAYWTVGSGARPSGARPGEPPYVGYSQELVDDVLGKVRTDLDRFTAAEMSVLENHGYWAAERSLRKHITGILPNPVPEPVTPYPEWTDEPLVRRGLRDSHKRFSLRRILSRDG